MTFEIQPPLSARTRITVLLIAAAGAAILIAAQLWVEAKVESNRKGWVDRRGSK